jgi:hypothetical protein
VTTFFKEAKVLSNYIFGWGRAVFGRGRGKSDYIFWGKGEEVVSGNIFRGGTGN